MQDLRSSLKYELERRGLEVRLSEEADFPVSGSTTSLEECLSLAKASDVYLLIIGDERGSRIGESSPTREEFRAVRAERRLTGKPEIILTVRGSTRDRASALKAQALLTDDEQFLVDLVQEVEAAPEEGDHNYLHRFSTFESLVTIVATRLSLGRNFDETVARHAILQEALANAAVGCSRSGTSAFPDHWRGTRAQDELSLTNADLTRHITVSQRVANSLASAFVLHRLSDLETAAMESALRDGHFLDFDPVSQVFIPSELRSAVAQLVRDVRTAKKIGGGGQTWIQTLMTAAEQANRLTTSVLVPGAAALWALAYYDRAENVFSGSVALAGHLLDPSRTPVPDHRRPRSPIHEMDVELWQEELDAADVERLVRNQVHPFGLRFAPGLLSDETKSEWALSLLAETRRRLRDQNPAADVDNLLSLDDMAAIINQLTVSDEEAIEDRGR